MDVKWNFALEFKWICWKINYHRWVETHIYYFYAVHYFFWMVKSCILLTIVSVFVSVFVGLFKGMQINYNIIQGW